MMNEVNGRLAYVVGDSYSNLAQLSGVMTATQFFKGVLDGSLPLNLTWMIGQGLSSVERNLLSLCKTYRTEIRFYGDEETVVVEKNQPVALSRFHISHNIFSKMSRMIFSFMHSGKKSVHRLGIFR